MPWMDSFLSSLSSAVTGVSGVSGSQESRQVRNVHQVRAMTAIVAAATLVSQKRIGSVDNFIDGGRNRLVDGFQGWSEQFGRVTAQNGTALESFDRMKFWIRDLENGLVGQVMNEEGLWNVIGEIGTAGTPEHVGRCQHAHRSDL